MSSDVLYRSFLSRAEGDYYTKQDSLEVVVGKVVHVDSRRMKMDVSVPVLGDNSLVKEIHINIPISATGAGIRFVPIPNSTYVILQKGLRGWVHLGYYTEGIEKVTLLKDFKEVTDFKPLRSLEIGEVEIASIGNNRLYLSKNGNVLIEDGYSNYILLDSVASLFTLFVSTGKFEFSGVRVRAGDILRNTTSDPKEEEYLNTSIDPIQSKEFTVLVGTLVDSSSGLDPEIVNSQTNVNMYPTVGILSLSTKVVNIKGEEDKIQNKILQFLLRMASGIGIGITETGELILYDYATNNYISFITGKQNGNPKTQFKLKIQNCEVDINSNDQVTIKNANFTFFIDKESIVKISNEKSSIYITKDNQLKVCNDKGSITVDANGGVTIQADSGNTTIQITSSGISIQTQGNMQVQTQGPIQLQSSAGINIMGSPVNINGALTVS